MKRRGIPLRSTYLCDWVCLSDRIFRGISNGVGISPRAAPVLSGRVKFRHWLALKPVLPGISAMPAARPYFFGQNHTPPWASTSQVVNCCRTFVIFYGW